ncbi:TetR/AcrR family transcriptional regulator [Granulicella paludicola]|uniref:TetR/AcrR family transcriptional regulator n=1 Tax=Granulicella paludicola TaxID=474951 RepID=UPI0021DF5182|nr:TetR/AcrR family transcriptional regulator [Granulicella paludicola]
MPFPSKTNRNAILSAALDELSSDGIRNLSLRKIAATLGLAPNAIYRYFSDRAALEGALADECARRLELVLRKATHPADAAKSIRRMADAYLHFAKNDRNLYEVFMSFHTPDHVGSPRQSLWTFTVEQVQRITGETHAGEAAVALWALLHGAATLEAGKVHGQNKPASGFEFGLSAWLLLAETHSSDVSSPNSMKGSRKTK